MVQVKKNGEFTFVFKPGRDAQSVFLAGDFNRWDPTQRRMLKNRDGSFRTTVSLRPGRYEYKFVVDGDWVDDPGAQQRVMNRFGTFNSVLTAD